MPRKKIVRRLLLPLALGIMRRRGSRKAEKSKTEKTSRMDIGNMGQIEANRQQASIR